MALPQARFVIPSLGSRVCVLRQLQLTNGMATVSSGSYDVLQVQQGCMNNSPNQLQALLGPLQCSPTETDLAVGVECAANSTVLQLLPQASSTDAMLFSLQMPGPADQGMQGGTTPSAGMQFVDASLTTSLQSLQSLQPGCMPQGYLQAPHQQMVLVDMTSQPAASAGTGDSNAMQLQMQQLSAAVQQLKSQTAAVQQLLLSTQAGTPQSSVTVAGASNMVSRLEH